MGKGQNRATMIIAIVVLCVLIAIIVGIVTLVIRDTAGVESWLSQLWLDVQIVVGVFAALGAWALVVKIRRMSKYHIIYPSGRGEAQAMVDAHGRVTELGVQDGDAVYEGMKRLYEETQVSGRAAQIAAGQTVAQIAAPTDQLDASLVNQLTNIPQALLSTNVKMLQYNKLQINWGTRLDGQNVITTLPTSTHILKSGVTGMGKSWLTRCELYSLITRNDPETIRIAYIDLEGETTEPFWNGRHTWTYLYENANKEHVAADAIVQELEQLESLLIAIDEELTWRDRNRDDPYPYLLVVIEEAEELLEALDELPKASQKRILRLLNRVARRGRKRKILLDLNIQNTYTIPLFKKAQRQFQLKITGAQQPSTAAAGGFQDLELLKILFALQKAGYFVVKYVGGECLIRAQYLDVDMEISDLDEDDEEDGDGDEVEGSIEERMEDLPMRVVETQRSVPSVSDRVSRAPADASADASIQAKRTGKPVPVGVSNNTSEKIVNLRDNTDPLTVFTLEQRLKILEEAEACTPRRDIPGKVGFGSPKFKAMNVWLDAHGYTVEWYQERRAFLYQQSQKEQVTTESLEEVE